MLGRDGLACAILSDGSVVVMGGYGAVGFVNDVWKSTNGGLAWTQLTAAPAFGNGKFVYAPLLSED